MEKKMSTPVEILCKGLPSMYFEYLKKKPLFYYLYRF